MAGPARATDDASRPSFFLAVPIHAPAAFRAQVASGARVPSLAVLDAYLGRGAAGAPAHVVCARVLAGVAACVGAAGRVDAKTLAREWDVGVLRRGGDSSRDEAGEADDDGRRRRDSPGPAEDEEDAAGCVVAYPPPPAASPPAAAASPVPAATPRSASPAGEPDHGAALAARHDRLLHDFRALLAARRADIADGTWTVERMRRYVAGAGRAALGPKAKKDDWQRACLAALDDRHREWIDEGDEGGEAGGE